MRLVEARESKMFSVAATICAICGSGEHLTLDKGFFLEPTPLCTRDPV